MFELHSHGPGLTARLDSFFKTLVNHEVTVELKNDISIRGTLKSVDQYLNIKLDDIMVLDDIKYPHLVCSSGVGRINDDQKDLDSRRGCGHGHD